MLAGVGRGVVCDLGPVGVCDLGQVGALGWPCSVVGPACVACGARQLVKFNWKRFVIVTIIQ